MVYIQNTFCKIPGDGSEFKKKISSKYFSHIKRVTMMARNIQ